MPPGSRRHFRPTRIRGSWNPSTTPHRIHHRRHRPVGLLWLWNYHLPDLLSEAAHRGGSPPARPDALDPLLPGRPGHPLAAAGISVLSYFQALLAQFLGAPDQPRRSHAQAVPIPRQFPSVTAIRERTSGPPDRPGGDPRTALGPAPPSASSPRQKPGPIRPSTWSTPPSRYSAPPPSSWTTRPWPRAWRGDPPRLAHGRADRAGAKLSPCPGQD